VPTYEYVCQSCGRPFEIRTSIADYAKGLTPRCPHCQSERAIRAFTSVQMLTSRGGTGSVGGCGPAAGPGCCG
jgi:putative FmdB family regulatory protein